MATPPDFTAGQVLTAAQMNQAGMWLVKSQAVGTAVPSVTVTNAFNADFNAYKIIATNVVSSAAGFCTFQLTGLTTGYYGNIIIANYSSGSVTSFGTNNGSSAERAGGMDGLFLNFNIDVVNPFLARPTTIQGHYQEQSVAGVLTYVQNSSTSSSGFTLTCEATRTLTGGTINVYGYRK
jgi:hypothetical protein